MKKILSIVLLVITCISCTNQERSSTIDPTKLALVIVYPNTTAEQHWSFNGNGLLKDIKKADGTVLQQFFYDANNNLVSNSIYSNGAATTTNTFTYDNDGHVASANGIPVTYNSTENAYVKNVIYGDENFSYTYYLNTEQLLTRQAYQMVSPDGPESGEDYVSHLLNGNLIWYYDGDASTGDYQYDTKINPFKTALLPIVRAVFITGSNVFPTTNWCIGEYSSDNNVHSNGYDSEGVEDTTYDYEFNANNLPIKRISNNYYLGNLEGSATHTLYYYQGDVIP